MAEPKLRRRRKLPLPPVQTMELLGLGPDGHLYVWQDKAQVQPLSHFPDEPGRLFSSGHYLIEWKGHAITVHCGLSCYGQVVVQFMCGGLPTIALAKKAVETMLLGKVLKDPVVEARILANLRQLTEDADRENMQPSRRRGKL